MGQMKMTVTVQKTLALSSHLLQEVSLHSYVFQPLSYVRDYVVQLFKNPLVYAILAVLAMVYFREMMVAIRRVSKGENPIKTLTPPIPSDVQLDGTSDPKETKANDPSPNRTIKVLAVKVEPVEDSKAAADAEKITKVAKADSLKVPSDESPVPAKLEKKKVYQGSRGGVKHKKGRNQAVS